MKNLLPTKTFLLIVILILVTALLLFLALKIQNNQLPNKISTTISQMLPQTDLAFTEPVATRTANFKTEFESMVNIETGQNKVTTVQLELSYDPKQLAIVDIASGSFFPKPTVLLKKIDPIGGTVSYAVSSQDQKGISGKGTIAILTFTEIAGQSGKTQLDFLPKTQITAENIIKSALESTTGIVFNLGSTPFPKQLPSSSVSAK